MPIPDVENSILSETTTSSTGPLGRTLNDWADIKLDDGLVENVARAQIQSQVQGLIRGIRLPWKTVELIPPSMESVVMDILQQELDDAHHPDRYRTACMKCLRALCKARSIVPSSLFLRDVTKEGDNAIDGGGFADIWKGYFRNTQVCLKVLRIFGTEEEKIKVLRDFCQEALVWRQLLHPNVLPFLGVSKDLFAPRYCLISSWMINGNIMSYLEAHPDHDRLTSLVQIAEGMKYLHNLNPPIVHADIRGANILVKNDLCCCLADFGLSLFVESQTLNSSSRMSKGSVRWLAPEYIDPDVVIDQAYVTARDVYAYGCTIVEIFTGGPPFGYIKSEAAIMLAVIAGKRPLRPQHILQDGLWSLVTTCLINSPGQRPTAERISKVLADGDFLADSWNDGWIGPAGATTVLQHRSPTQTDVLSRSGPQTPVPPSADVRHNNMPTPLYGPIASSHTSPGRVSSISRPIRSRTIGFNNFISWRHSTIHRPNPPRASLTPVSSLAPGGITPISPAQRYPGWLSEVIRPLEEFIDEPVDPREVYLDLQEIAEGGTGSVYAATLADDKSHRLKLPPLIKAQDNDNARNGIKTLVAIKSVAILPSGSEKLADLEHELKLLKGLMHPNILGLDALYVDYQEDSLWIRMELMERCLTDVIGLVTEGVMLGERIMARFASDVLGALVYLQLHGIAHRDVRSDNLLLNSHGILKLTDFSNAIQTPSQSSTCSDPVGVLYWQAPEVRCRPYDPLKVDVWSLGATVWEMAEAEPPFFQGSEAQDRWPPLTHLEVYSSAFREFLRACSDPPATRPSPAELADNPLINSCGSPDIIQVLSQCRAIEGIIQEQWRDLYPRFLRTLR